MSFGTKFEDVGPELPTLAERVEDAKRLVDAGTPTLAPNEERAPAEPRPEASAEVNRTLRVSMVLRKYRVITEIEAADLAKQMGITTRQLTAFEQGKDCGSSVLAAVMGWLLGLV